MQIQEAERGDWRTSGALLVSRVGGGGGQLKVLVVTLGDLAGDRGWVGIGSLVVDMVAGSRATLDTVSMFRDGAAAASVKTAFLVLWDISPGATERGVNGGLRVKAGLITDKVGPIDARGSGGGWAVEGNVHVSGRGRVLGGLGCFLKETQILGMFPFFNDPVVDLALVGFGFPSTMGVLKVFLDLEGDTIGKLLDGFGFGDGAFSLYLGDLVQGTVFSDVQGNEVTSPEFVGVSKSSPEVVLGEPGFGGQEVVV
jgi:hypothetical protein